MKLSTLLLFWILLGTIQGFSQTLKGKIVDQNNLPIEDVYLQNTSKGIHAHSSKDGIFELESIPGDTIAFSHIAYETQLRVLTARDFEKVLKVKMATRFIDLGEIVISNDLKVLNEVSKIDLAVNPVSSSQEVLKQVPGLFIGQHAGGGKAEQIFLRGFDIDHGTDINIQVDGMPVNMVSHAHGQGYADLHFLIPETIEKIDFGKGPYYSDKGNFATAGYVDFQTKDKLDNSDFSLEFGQFNTLRMVGLYNLTGNSENHQAYAAAEYLVSDGYFESPQNFNRINLMGKYTGTISDDQRISVTASHFRSKWNASGQIPQRAVDAGLITRYGAIDDTEGGSTSRTNLLLSHTKYINDDFSVKSRAFYSKYDFELFSNFTFFLNDPVNGDQIRQQESRDIMGVESSLHEKLDLGFAETNIQGGLGFRYDRVSDVGLSHTANRKTTLERYAFGDVNEANFYGFLHAEFDFGKWLINPAVRVDYFRFDYEDKLDSVFTEQSEGKARVSPKLNVMYSPNEKLQVYAKSGIGFHSNDTRVVVARSGEEILPAAYGSDLGMIWKPIPKLMINSALWALFLDQEFVYVGDEGVVEPSGRSRRLGIDFGLRYEPIKGLFLNGDVNYAFARSIDAPEGEDYIPLAPDLTATGGIFYTHSSGFNGGIKSRFLKTRPANEDNSISAKGYVITDLNLGYVWKGLHFGVVIENLFDSEWNETQFATETRLRNEVESVEEIHFTPGRPFFLKGVVGFRF